MNFKFKQKYAVLLLCSCVMLPLSVSAETTKVQTLKRHLATEQKNEKLVVDFYQQFFNEHQISAAHIIAEDYKQHNPYVPDGKMPFVSYFTEAFKKNPHSRVNIVRTATQGDLVYLHVHAQENSTDRGQAVIDIFRVKAGKIVEHWDVIQEIPEQSANENSMF